MRTLWTFVPGVVLAAGAFGLAGVRMHTEQPYGTADCGSLLSSAPARVHPDIWMRGPGFVPGPTCGSLRDTRTAEVAAVAGLGVLALGGATWRWWWDAPLREVRHQVPAGSGS